MSIFKHVASGKCMSFGEYGHHADDTQLTFEDCSLGDATLLNFAESTDNLYNIHYEYNSEISNCVRPNDSNQAVIGLCDASSNFEIYKDDSFNTQLGTDVKGYLHDISFYSHDYNTHVEKGPSDVSYYTFKNITCISGCPSGIDTDSFIHDFESFECDLYQTSSSDQTTQLSYDTTSESLRYFVDIPLFTVNGTTYNIPLNSSGEFVSSGGWIINNAVAVHSWISNDDGHNYVSVVFSSGTRDISFHEDIDYMELLVVGGGGAHGGGDTGENMKQGGGGGGRRARDQRWAKLTAERRSPKAQFSLLLLIDGSGERRPEPRHGRVSRGVTPDDFGTLETWCATPTKLLSGLQTVIPVVRSFVMRTITIAFRDERNPKIGQKCKERNQLLLHAHFPDFSDF